MKKGYLGIDVGSVSTNLIVIDEKMRSLPPILRTRTTDSGYSGRNETSCPALS